MQIIGNSELHVLVLFLFVAQLYNTVNRLYFESVTESKVNQNVNIKTTFCMLVDNFNQRQFKYMNIATWLLLAILGIVLAIAIRVDEISKILKKNKNKKD